MKRLGISKQILLIAILPALIVAATLSIYYVSNQFGYISDSLSRNGKLIAKQLSPAAEYAVYSGNIELISPLIDTIIQNNPVLRLQLLDKDNNSILDITPAEKPAIKSHSMLKKIFGNDESLVFNEAIFTKPVAVEDLENKPEKTSSDTKENQIGKVIVTLTTRYATEEKIAQIEQGIIITLTILFLTTLITFRINSIITRPIKSLTRTVRSITAGDLDAHVDFTSTGELGILESCIDQMKNELKNSQTDLEQQLDVFTDELQQTLEELEVRNAELDITRSKAILANNAKSEFLANMSHEIRTPLSGIIGFTELLQGTDQTNQQKDYSSTIQKSAKSLLEIINDILDLSKIESGKTEITASEFNLIDIIEDIITLLSPTALEKNIELFYRIEKDVAITVSADPFRIHQIITNLIGNAIKFTDTGYVYLQVTTGDIKNTERSIKFAVSDTGIGMSGEDKNKLFKAFTQADSSITRRFGGTGLGLVISRKLTLLMSGEIGFDSTDGEGSTFWFSIPVIPIKMGYELSELANKKIAFINNHFIAKQTFKTLFDSCNCEVTDYTSDDLSKINSIEDSNDIIVVFMSRREINDGKVAQQLHELAFSKPSLLIASTQSHTELRKLQQHNFDNSAFTSEKIDRIKQKLINTISRDNLESDNVDTNENLNDTFDWSNLNIMVVDDNEVNLRLAEIILHKHKAKVTTARSGMQAIDQASLNSFDIIFMDLHMPGIDGHQTTQRIREISSGKQPVIVALTANAMPNEKEKVIHSGMNGILIKPVSDAILQNTINQWVLKRPISPVEKTHSSDKKAINDDAVFSITAAKEFTGNNETLAYELFNMLRAELAKYSKDISAAILNNDLEALRNQAHRLHGSSRCCGTQELKQASSHIENLINQKIDFDIKKESTLLLTAIQNVADYKMDSVNGSGSDSI